MKMTRLLPLAAVAGLICMAAPSSAAPLEVDTAGLQKLLKGGAKQVFLLDVRTPGEYAAGRIPGSVPIPMNQVERRLAEIPRDKKVVAICASGARSAAVARFLADNGYPWVANYGGGVSEWARRGLPLER
jgi:rhodanese-related sulfurtransferase